MKNSLLIFALLFTFFLSSCEKNLIDVTTPKAAKNLKEAKARLVEVKKWKVEEISINNMLVYTNGANVAGANGGIDEELEWVRFTNEGVFEIKYTNEPIDTSMKYKLDEANNNLVIYDDTSGESYFENWTIEAGSVFKDSFSMSMIDTDDGDEIKISITLKAL
jgi:hypothetical protein